MNPWQDPVLREWSIVGMNHYHTLNGQRRLFVAMVKDGHCIKEEGADDEYLWNRLCHQAWCVDGKEPNGAARQKPAEAPVLQCPNCESAEVGTFTANNWFLYGVEKQYRLVAENVLFFRCMYCGLEYTGEDGERKRSEAVRNHLARLRKAGE